MRNAFTELSYLSILCKCKRIISSIISNHWASSWQLDYDAIPVPSSDNQSRRVFQIGERLSEFDLPKQIFWTPFRRSVDLLLPLSEFRACFEICLRSFRVEFKLTKQTPLNNSNMGRHYQRTFTCDKLVLQEHVWQTLCHCSKHLVFYQYRYALALHTVLLSRNCWLNFTNT